MPTDPLAAAVAPVAENIVANITDDVIAKIGSAGTVRIYGSIGMGESAISATSLAKDLANIKESQIDLRLNSDGGNIFQGIAIYNSLKNHPARVVAHVEGLAASIASYVAMAADEIRIANNAYMMIHNPMVAQQFADADELRKTADMLDQLRDTIIDGYATRTKKPREEIARMMEEETWLNATQAVAMGFADSIEGEAVRLVAANLNAFGNVPDALKEQTALTTPEASLRSDPVPATHTQENSIMSQPNPAAPAPETAAVPAIQVTPVNPIITEAEARQHELVRLNQTAINGYTEQGRKAGIDQGKMQEYDRVRVIAELCPGKPDIALASILAKHTPEVAKIAFDAAASADAKTKVIEEAKNLEISRLTALVATGGFAGGVPLGIYEPIEDSQVTGSMSKEDARIQASNEWDHKPGVRKGFTSKDRYVAFRMAETSGRARVFNEPVQQ